MPFGCQLLLTVEGASARVAWASATQTSRWLEKATWMFTSSHKGIILACVFWHAAVGQLFPLGCCDAGCRLTMSSCRTASQQGLCAGVSTLPEDVTAESLNSRAKFKDTALATFAGFTRLRWSCRCFSQTIAPLAVPSHADMCQVLSHWVLKLLV